MGDRNNTQEKNDAIKKIINALDVNGDGRLGIEDIIILGLRTPGVHINRTDFLKREFHKYCSDEVVDKAIRTTPAEANIDRKLIDRVANACIEAERLKVTGIATALGTPGGLLMAATIPADLIQYYAYTLRAIQELLYLYGFPDIDNSDMKGVQIDAATMNTIIVCMGVMYGVVGTNNAIRAMAKALSVGVEKKLLNTALTKGMLYPIVKNVARWFGIAINKKIFAGFFKKAIPVVGGVIGGTVTFLSFKPCCLKLKAALEDTILSNPNHKETKEESECFSSIQNGEIFEGEFTDITEEFIQIYDPLDLNKDGLVDEEKLKEFNEKFNNGIS